MALVVYGLVLLATLQSVSAGDDCEPYYKNGQYQWKQSCLYPVHCCGLCDDRYCCSNPLHQLTEYEQEMCVNSINNNNNNNTIKNIDFRRKKFGRRFDSTAFFSVFIPFFITALIILIYICHKKCNTPEPVVPTTTDTVLACTQYPQNPQNPTPTQQYPAYYPGNQQHQGYGTPAPYGAGPGGYPVNYSSAAFTPGQQSYPMQTPMHSGYLNQPVSPATADLNAQPAYNPDNVAPTPAKY